MAITSRIESVAGCVLMLVSLSLGLEALGSTPSVQIFYETARVTDEEGNSLGSGARINVGQMVTVTKGQVSLRVVDGLTRPALPLLEAGTTWMYATVMNPGIKIVSNGRTISENAPVGSVILPGDTLENRAIDYASVNASANEIVTLAPKTKMTFGRDKEAGMMILLRNSFAIIGIGRPAIVRFKFFNYSGSTRGTGLFASFNPDGSIGVRMLDGRAEFDNLYDGAKGNGESVKLVGGTGVTILPDVDVATVRPLELRDLPNLVRWTIRHPIILSPNEIMLSEVEASPFEASIAAYREGDLSAALQAFPNEDNMSDKSRLFKAALLVGGGQLDVALTLLSKPFGSSRDRLLGLALRRFIVAVNGGLMSSPGGLQLASQWLAESYRFQIQAGLAADHSQAGVETSSDWLHHALEAAQRAVQLDPSFGAALARVGELEYVFGRYQSADQFARAALDISPRLNRAIVLLGFAQWKLGNRKAAMSFFEQASFSGPDNSEAWVGLGLTRMSVRAMQAGGLADFEQGARAEPGNSLARSYLAKAYATIGLYEAAVEQIEIAKRLDPDDPTPLLYSALIRREMNSVNTAVRDLEESLLLNNNRRIYRSRLLLDQDYSIRSANLANIYSDVGMEEVSLRVAAASLAYDFANPSAHLFIADTFNSRRDPTRFRLREESVWLNELLLANILAPVGAASLSQQPAGLEYARLFHRLGLGLQTSSRYRSDGEFAQRFSQFGHYEKSAYSVDGEYFKKDGVRPNNELTRFELYATLKQQISATDSLLFLTKIQEFRSEDNFQYTDPARASRFFEWEEPQYPGLILGAYHREWSPGQHSMILGGRLGSEQEFRDRRGVSIFNRDLAGDLSDRLTQPMDLSVGNRFEAYTIEGSHIADFTDGHTLVAGTRFQTGTFDIHDHLTLATAPNPTFRSPPSQSQFNEDFNRSSTYAYYTISPLDDIWITGGVSYDHLTFPDNFRRVPLRPGSRTLSKWSPKASILWRPNGNVAVRSVYTRALGGVAFDDSVRLEPTQILGFPQAFRTVVSESIIGSLSGPYHEIVGAALDLKLGEDTYLGIVGESLESDVEQSRGIFEFEEGGSLPAVRALSTTELIAYQERSVGVSLNRLIGREWSLGLGYRFTRSELDLTLPGVLASSARPLPDSIATEADRRERGHLHRIRQFGIYNHPSGWFGGEELTWYAQENNGYSDGTAEARGDDVPQLNVFLGYRFHRQRASLRFGVLNLLDMDYRLNPLTPYLELPRERVFQITLQTRF